MPLLGGTTTDPTVTYYTGEHKGFYMKINDMVFIQGLIRATITNKGSGNICIRGLPFTADNTLSGCSMGLSTIVSGGIAGGHFKANDTIILMRSLTGLVDVGSYVLTTNQYLTFFGCYHVSS